MKTQSDHTASASYYDRSWGPARLPVWIGSAGIHLVLVILLASAWSNARTVELPERERSVAITIVPRGDDAPQEFLDAVELSAVSETDETMDLLASLPKPEASADAGSGSPQFHDDDAGTPLLTGQDLFGPLDFRGAGRGRFKWPGDGQGVSVEGHGTGAAGPVGPPARPNIFGVQAVGRTFVFVIDRSHSMGNETGGLRAAEQELLKALDDLRPEHAFQILAYNDQRRYLHRGGLLPAIDRNIRQAAEFLDGLTASAGTNHEMALLIATQWQPDVIFLFTDAGLPPLSVAQLQRISSATELQTTIHCVQFGVGPRQNDNFMPQLARMNRGRYTYVDAAAVRMP